MPFTPSHVVAVLPLFSGWRARYFNAAALTIGAMVPDLPYFVPGAVRPALLSSRWTHAWFGPVTIDLALGLVVYAVWCWARPALVDLAPRWWRLRLPRPPLLSARRWGVVAWSVVLGAVTHVLWDTFSHANRWGTEHVAWLTEPHGPLLGYKWVQYGSGVGGLLVLGLWGLAWLRRTPERPASDGTSRLAEHRPSVWFLVMALLAATVALTWGYGIVTSGRWLDEATAVRVATTTIGVCLGLVPVLRWVRGAPVLLGDRT